ncbi:MAG: hypothetical protein DPW17_12190 [Candidatus Jettenia sp.]|nr:hypothetical protein [Candidatus Jettenia sp.]
MIPLLRGVRGCVNGIMINFQFPIHGLGEGGCPFPSPPPNLPHQGGGTLCLNFLSIKICLRQPFIPRRHKGIKKNPGILVTLWHFTFPKRYIKQKGYLCK